MSSLLLSQRQLSILWTIEIYSIPFYLYISRNCFKTLRMALAARWRGLVPWKENSSLRQAAQNKLCGLPWVTRSGFLEDWKLGVIRAKGRPISLVNIIKRQPRAPETTQVETSPQGQISQDVLLNSGWSFASTVVEMLPWSTTHGEVLFILSRSTMDQWRDCICMEQTVTVTFPHGCAKGGKDDAAEEGKGFTNLLEFIQFPCKESCK